MNVEFGDFGKLGGRVPAEILRERRSFGDVKGGETDPATAGNAVFEDEFQSSPSKVSAKRPTSWRVCFSVKATRSELS